LRPAAATKLPWPVNSPQLNCRSRCLIHDRCRTLPEQKGRLAKTDRIDAQVLAQFADLIRPPTRRFPDAQSRELMALVARRCVAKRQNCCGACRPWVVSPSLLCSRICPSSAFWAPPDRCLVGVAPFNRDSDKMRGTRDDQGRARPGASTTLHAYAGGNAPEPYAASFLSSLARSRPETEGRSYRVHAQTAGHA
jgi:hypothetical protein